MRTQFEFIIITGILILATLPASAWSCQNNAQWQDTLRCQVYPTNAQTPPPAPPAPVVVDNLRDFTRVELPELDANNQPMRCLDGTQTIMYVDEAVEKSGLNNWLISFQGGGSCSDGQSCLNAYLDPNEQAEMGSALQPAMKNMDGIHSTRASNQFRNYNRIRIHKCGYDRFNGTSVVNNSIGIAGDVNNNGILTDRVNAPNSANWNPNIPSVQEGFAYSFDLYQQGKDHIRHALDQLLAGLSYSTWIDQGGNVESVTKTLPPMLEAKTILFVGHSGAAHGLIHNIDSLVDYISVWGNPNNGLSANIGAVFDAQLLPSAENEIAFTYDSGADLYDHEYYCNAPACQTSPPLHFNYDAKTYFLTAGGGTNGYFDGPYPQWNPELDSSCLVANQGADYRCTDRFHVLFNHVTTPFFIRQDFNDSNPAHNDGNNGHRLFWAEPEFRHCSDSASVEPCLPTLSRADFRARIEEQVERFSTDFATRSHIARSQPTTPMVYLWLPDCAEHAGAFDGPQFFDSTLANDLLLQELTMHDYLLSFVSDLSNSGVDIRMDGDNAWYSKCK